MKRLSLLVVALAAVGCAETTPTPTATRPTAALAPQPVPAVREAQQELRRLGYYGGAADGLWGPETETAVERFQRARGLDVTGRVNADTSAALRTATAPMRAAPAVAAPPPAPLPSLDATSVRTVQNRLKQLGFYEGTADGVWGPGTQASVKRFQRARGLAVDGQLGGRTLDAMGLDGRDFQQAGRTASLADPLDPAVVRTIQQRLRQQGFYNGGADGVWGPGTQAAVERFQQARGLQPTGNLNPTTIAALGLDPNNLTASATPPRGGAGGGWRR